MENSGCEGRGSDRMCPGLGDRDWKLCEGSVVGVWVWGLRSEGRWERRGEERSGKS